MERRRLTRVATAGALNAAGAGALVGPIGLEIEAVEGRRVVGSLAVRDEPMAPNGFLHAATVGVLADTTAGHCTRANLPEGAEGFATVELKTNFIGTARAGRLRCEATMMHGGRSAQVWDAVVSSDERGKRIALVRCTQSILSGGRRGPARAERRDGGRSRVGADG